MRAEVFARLRQVLLPILLLQAVAWGGLLAVDGLQRRLPQVTHIEAQKLAAPDPALIDATRWQAQDLPLRTCKITCPDGWVPYTVFRHRFLHSASSYTPLAIYLRYVESSAAVHLNGRLLYTAGAMHEPIANLQYMPLYVDIPAEALRPGENELLIVVAEEVRGFGKLLPFHVGAAAELRPAWYWATFVNQRIQPWSTAVFAVALLLSLGVTIFARGGAVFGWFAALVTACALANPLLWPSDPPLPALMRWTIYYTAGIGILAAATGFMTALAGRRLGKLEYIALVAAAIAVLAIGVVLANDLRDGVFFGNRVIRVAVLVFAPLLLLRLIAAFRGQWDAASTWGYAIFSVTLALSLHDVIAGLDSGFVWLMYTHIGVTLLVVAFCIVLAQRYGHRLSSLEASNENLTRRIRTKELELAQDFDRLRALNREQILEGERQRIMRDMHDGIGGRLASLLLRLKPGAQPVGEIREALQESLNDLRLIIDSLDGAVADDPAVALGTFRVRVEPWLRQHGMALDWAVDVTGAGGLGAEKTLQIYRLLQEACSNAVRHAQARRLGISATISDEPRKLCIAVVDDGRGFATHSREGRGLGNMRRRAAQIGGTLAISTSGTGTRLELQVPVAPAELSVPAQARA
jgi:signal transduction histidine kinase